MELLDELERRATDRMEYETAWLEIAELAFPLSGWMPPVGGVEARRASLNQLTTELHSARRSSTLYDTTMYRAINVTAAGIEGFMTPAGMKWGELGLDDLFSIDQTHEEKLWLERTNNFLFAQRYDSDSGFSTANTQAIRGVTALGTGVFMTEGTEDLGLGIEDPFRYTFMPLFENYMGADIRGRNDSNYRWTHKTAVNLAKRYGYENLSATVQAMVDDPARRHEMIEFLHVVQLRDEKGMRGSTNRDSLYASYVVEKDTQHMIEDGGYFTFPYTVYKWSNAAQTAYGETPVMALLGNQKSLHMASMNQDIAVQQAVAPPMATVGEYDVDLNPEAVNPGLLDRKGVPQYKTMIENPRPDISQAHIEVKQADIEKAMGTHLWVTGADHPQMTAYEVQVRNQERVLQLGPAGNIIQEAQSLQTEREIDIIGRRGVFAQGAPLEPPASVLEKGASVKAEFVSPYARARRTGELQGIQQTLEGLALVAQVKPEVRHKLDEDKTLESIRSITGAPVDMFVDEETYQQRVNDEKRQQQMAASLAAGQQGADIAKTAGEAQAAANESGLADGPIGEFMQQATGG